MSAAMSVVTAKESAGEHPVPWSFRPLQSAVVPAVRNTAWPRTRMDSFLLAKMEAAKVEPAKPATPRVLIRRLYFDLLGLPPSPEELAHWEEVLGPDGKPAAVAQFVESLLASPHYGERWGRYWLDLARYTDKTPDYLDNSASAWLYRDWVVKAFNDDMRYDEFVRRQLAVDLMPGSKPEERHALGFLGLSPTYFKELKLPPEIIKGTVADEWEEHVDAVGRTFLGLTLACARCHDHKSDPITAADYYGIAGVFASVRITPVPAMSDELWAPVAKARGEVAKLEKEIVELKKKPARPEFAAHVAAMQAARLAETEKKIADIKAQTTHYNVPMANGVEDAALYVISAGEKEGTKLDYRKGQARDLEIQKRGNPNQTGDVVKRRFLSAFPARDGKPREFTTGSGRLELAKAIIEDATPLTARVIVNRVWRHHFGRGLVGTPSEFGAMGEAPTHPELLDDLTARFVANGWSLKWLHREILLSAAWQQDSLAPKSERVDPENRLFARMPRRRLDVEAWRDSMLAVSGLLDRKSGGPSEALSEEKNHRRTLYGTVNRDELDPMLRINDFPEPSAHSATRPETSTPLQMLFALNSSFLQQQADALADRIGHEASQPVQDRVRRAYALSYQREPTTRELAVAAHFFEGREGDRKAWSAYTQALLASNEMLFID
jgi:hypothetical protein